MHLLGNDYENPPPVHELGKRRHRRQRRRLQHVLLGARTRRARSSTRWPAARSTSPSCGARWAGTTSARQKTPLAGRADPVEARRSAVRVRHRDGRQKRQSTRCTRGCSEALTHQASAPKSEQILKDFNVPLLERKVEHRNDEDSWVDRGELCFVGRRHLVRVWTARRVHAEPGAPRRRHADRRALHGRVQRLEVVARVLVTAATGTNAIAGTLAPDLRDPKLKWTEGAIRQDRADRLPRRWDAGVGQAAHRNRSRSCITTSSPGRTKGTAASDSGRIKSGRTADRGCRHAGLARSRGGRKPPDAGSSAGRALLLEALPVQPGLQNP